VDVFDLPEVFRSARQGRGWDYEKIFVDTTSHHYGHKQAYQSYGMSPKSGCIVVARPDQHVSYIGELEDIDQVEAVFCTFTQLP
jgi:phenol 2-monooxygenase (NADPH)